MKISIRIKKAFMDWCARLEKANKESFGNGSLDCCDLNRPPKKKS